MMFDEEERSRLDAHPDLDRSTPIGRLYRWAAWADEELSVLDVCEVVRSFVDMVATQDALLDDVARLIDYHSGGVVSGPTRMVVAHGGETVLPLHKRGEVCPACLFDHQVIVLDEGLCSRCGYDARPPGAVA